MCDIGSCSILLTSQAGLVIDPTVLPCGNEAAPCMDKIEGVFICLASTQEKCINYDQPHSIANVKRQDDALIGRTLVDLHHG